MLSREMEDTGLIKMIVDIEKKIEKIATDFIPKT